MLFGNGTRGRVRYCNVVLSNNGLLPLLLVSITSVTRLLDTWNGVFIGFAVIFHYSGDLMRRPRDLGAGSPIDRFTALIGL